MDTLIDISDTILKTERLVLRPWRQSDLDDLYAYASVDGAGRMEAARGQRGIPRRPGPLYRRQEDVCPRIPGKSDRLPGDRKV